MRLEDIRLITNENDEYYKNLPGYYNKHENDSDFLQPKRRVKSRRERHDDDRNRPRNGEPNKRHEKEIKNVRRGARKEEFKKKEPEEIKLKLDLLDLKDSNQPLTPSTPSCDIEVKVAHPAESSAAFWGRMRVKPPLPISPHSPNLIHESFNHLEDNSFSSSQKIDKTESKPIISTKVDISPIDVNRRLDKNIYESAENQNLIQNVVSSRSEDKSTILNAAPNTVKAPIKSSPLSKLPSKNVTHALLVKETELQSNSQTQGSLTTNMNSHSLKSLESTKLSENREKSSSRVIDECLTLSSSSESLSSLSSESLSSKVIDVTNKVNLASSITMLNSIESDKPFLKTSNTENFQHENILHFAKELPLISQDEIMPDVRDDVDNTTDNSEESVSTDESSKDRKKKKKVSFATDAQIIDSGNSTISHSPALNNQTPNCEPGKIKLPPEHIEKHINEFTQAPDMRQQNLLQATYNHNGVPIIQQLPGVLPMYYQSADQVLAPVAFSHDSEGKDLPEGTNIDLF